MAAQAAATLELENGDRYEVAVDQRDYETAEQTLARKGITGTDNPVTFTRCLAWAAARRVGKTTEPWWDFTKTLVQADLGQPEPVDPTPPATSAG